MDPAYTERRALSRCGSRKSYADDDTNMPLKGPWPPARRLEETKTLLASPGPLESMLKKTTETGDIGVYSVGPRLSMSRSRPSVRSGSNSGGGFPARTMSMDTPRRHFMRDDRRGLPSYRDTTSEILSMYGTNGQRYAPAAFSRSADDTGPRSYSLTSCNSRQMSDQKSTGTGDSRSSGGSGGFLPRPRSPYPYHTRLKRPGVRPSSPALTLDGSIDYSRMVEIDRPSYRTIHRSYRGPHPPNMPRPPLPRYQPGDGSESRGLSSAGDSNFTPRPGSSPPVSHQPWLSQPHVLVDSRSPAQQMYGPSHAPSVKSHPPISRSGSFYYDYSEDFQVVPRSTSVPCVPISPIPRRSPSMNRPMVLEDGCEPLLVKGATAEESTLTAVPEQSYTDQLLPAGSSTDLETPLDTLQREVYPEDDMLAGSIEQPKPDEGDYGEAARTRTEDNRHSNSSHMMFEEMGVDTDAPVVPEKYSEYSSKFVPRPSGVPSAEKSLTDSAAAVEVDDAKSKHHLELYHLGIDQHPDLPSTGRGTMPASSEVSRNRDPKPFLRSSGDHDASNHTTIRGSKVYSLQSGLLDLKSFVQDLDEAGLLQGSAGSLDPPESARSSTLQSRNDETLHVQALLLGTNRVLEAEYEKLDPSANGSPMSCLHQQDRNLAERSISNGQLENNCQHHQSGDALKLAILAPQPVSPVRPLKVRSSVSKLMKALPPLPDEREGTESQCAMSPIAELGSASVGVASSSPTENSKNTTGLSLQLGSRKGDRSDALKYYGVSAGQLVDSRSDRDMFGDLWDRHFETSVNTGAAISGNEKEYRAIPAAFEKQSFDIAFVSHRGLRGQQKGNLCRTGRFKSSTARAKPPTREGLSSLNAISYARGTSLDAGPERLQKLGGSCKPPAALQTQGAFREDRNVKGVRGLKKRLSDMKIRLTESRQRTDESSSSDIRVDGERIGLAIPVTTPGSTETGGETSNSKSGSDDSFTRGLRYRISRWMRSAKNAVNACKRLSSSTGGTSLDTDF